MGTPVQTTVPDRKIDDDGVRVFLTWRFSHLNPRRSEAARHWLVERIAERAVEIVREADAG